MARVVFPLIVFFAWFAAWAGLACTQSAGPGSSDLARDATLAGEWAPGDRSPAEERRVDAGAGERPAGEGPRADRPVGDRPSDGPSTDRQAKDGQAGDRQASDRQRGDRPADALAADESAAYLWKGFEHEWLRELLGFRIPHRLSKLHTFIDGERHWFAGSPAGWGSDALFHFGQSTGVDGNYMKPVGYYDALFAAELHVQRGSVRLSWTDDADESEYPQARSDWSQTLTVDLDTPALARGTLDEYGVVLRGIQLDTACDDAKQPPDRPCNSDGMWPFRVYVGVDACQRAGLTLHCPLAVQIYRAWTPNQGGLPPFEIKPFNDKLDFALVVHYTVVGGAAAALHLTYGSPVVSSGRAWDADPVVRSQVLFGEGRGRYPTAVAALVAFGFELGPADPNEEKQKHLGRYIGTYRFRAQDLEYRPDSGELTCELTTQVWVPITVADATVSYEMRAVLLQLGPARQTLVSGKGVEGRLCVNSHGAPPFSTWTGCSDPDKGPEQMEEAVPIAAP